MAYLYVNLTKRDPIPIVEDEYWGPKLEQGKKEDTSIRPFKIDISANVIEDLKQRLTRELQSSRLAAPLEGIGFEYGFNSKFLKTVGQYWLSKYDWRAREKQLNKYLQFKTKIGGLDIHFYHIKPKTSSRKKSRPLLLMHGWPGSIVEYQKIIPLLSEPKNSKYNYELVIPSLPGFGFSDPAVRHGLGIVEISSVFRRLMERLGHTKFYVMGEDYGSLISTDMSTLYPDSSHFQLPSGVGHIRAMISSVFPSYFAPDIAKHIRPYSEVASFMTRESGYLHIQGTKPDTVGTGLTHSPLGLAAYILEKFSTWTNRNWINREDGGLLENFTMDELLDNVMVYWVTESITTSQRLYAEFLLPNKKHILDKVTTNVPFNCQFMAEDLIIFPKLAATGKYTNIKRYSVAEKGGHFGAFEVPEIVGDDAVSFFDSL